MPPTSKFMIAFGAVLAACGFVGLTAAHAPLQAGIGAGVAMFAAGAAAAQRRPSLRRCGIFVGILIPVLCLAFYGYHAWQAARARNALGEAATRPLHTILLAILAVSSLVTVLVLMKLRAGDNIAERGYSVLPASSLAPSVKPASPHPQSSSEQVT